MVNLLLVSPRSENSQGGMTVWTEAFLDYCSENNVKCDLLNIATIGSRAKQGNSKRNFKDEYVRTKAIFGNLKQMLRSAKYDVAHLNTSCGSFGLIRDYLIARKIKKEQPKCKCIVHFHCDLEKKTQVRYKAYFLGKILKIADEVLVLNKGNERYLHEAYGFSAVAVPNFINEKFVASQEKQIASHIKRAVFVGYVQPQKGAAEIYELARNFPEITFELIGEVRKDVQEWEKPDNVVLKGPMPHREIAVALDEADVFVFPTYSEGFSIALLESMSRGLPCITTKVGANEEMLEGKGGVVVPVGDTISMVNALKAMQDPAVRKEMSAWNIEKVRTQYTVQNVMKKIVESYVNK